MSLSEHVVAATDGPVDTDPPQTFHVDELARWSGTVMLCIYSRGEVVSCAPLCLLALTCLQRVVAALGMLSRTWRIRVWMFGIERSDVSVMLIHSSSKPTVTDEALANTLFLGGAASH